MNLDQLPYFIAIASYGSLSAASRHLNVTQQALSSYLTELEKTVGMPLFFRNSQKLYLTDAGRRYLKTAREILNVVGRTRNTIEMLGRMPDEELHVGISPHTGAQLLAECMLEFTQRYPRVRLIPHEGYWHERRRLLEAGTILLALTSMNAESVPGMQSIPVFRDEFLLALPAYHPRAHRVRHYDALPVADLYDFRDEVFVLPSPEIATYKIIEPLFRQAGFRPTVAASSPNITMHATLIRTGTGIGFLRYSEDTAFSFYRLKNPPYSYNGVVAMPTHVFSEPERYLIYLINKHNMLEHNVRINSDMIQDIIREFGDMEYLGEQLL